MVVLVIDFDFDLVLVAHCVPKGLWEAHGERHRLVEVHLCDWRLVVRIERSEVPVEGLLASIGTGGVEVACEP